MGEKSKNILKKIVYWTTSNIAIAIPVYTLYYLIMFYILTSNSEWNWRYVTTSLWLGIFSGLFFRFVVYGEGYDRKKRIKILIWIIIGVVLVGAAVETIIKRVI